MHAADDELSWRLRALPTPSSSSSAPSQAQAQAQGPEETEFRAYLRKTRALDWPGQSAMIFLRQLDDHRRQLSAADLCTAYAPSRDGGGIGGDGASAASPAPPPAYQNIAGTVPRFDSRTGDPPPTYDDVVNPNAPPPSYQSLFGAMRDASKASTGVLDLTRRLAVLVASALGCSLLLLLSIFAPLAMILIGGLYFDECRAGQMPLFLILGGLLSFAKNALNCAHHCRADHAGGAQDERLAPRAASSKRRLKMQNSALNLALGVWFLAGCVLVARNSSPDFVDGSSARYCNKLVYSFTFVLVLFIAGSCASLVVLTLVLMLATACGSSHAASAYC